MVFGWRLFARPKPTPEPNIWHIATRTGRDKFWGKGTVLPMLQHTILSVLKYVIILWLWYIGTVAPNRSPLKIKYQNDYMGNKGRQKVFLGNTDSA
jgi:hypothetical protein